MSKGLWQPGDIVFTPTTRMYTEREVIYREREAFENGLIRGTAREFDGAGGGMAALRAAVAKAFPLPKVTRPRVVREHDGRREWKRCEHGYFDFRTRFDNGGTSDWFCSGDPSAAPLPPSHERIRIWADLLDNPTEVCDADE